MSADHRAAVLEHIDGLFQAYLRKDRAAIEAGHTADWRGFPVLARRLVRGLPEYMAEADAVLAHLRAVRYEFLDREVLLFGDLALVYYVARDFLRAEDGEISILLRALDVYRREPGGWNQCGSHIAALPETLAPPADPRRPAEDVQRQVLAARERLWRAYFAGPAALAPLLAPETLAFHAGDGARHDRAAILEQSAMAAQAGAKLTALEFPRTDWLAYGGVVILLTEYAFTLATGAERAAQRGRATEVFAFRDGRWWNTAWHLEAAGGA